MDEDIWEVPGWSVTHNCRCISEPVHVNWTAMPPGGEAWALLDRLVRRHRVRFEILNADPAQN